MILVTTVVLLLLLFWYARQVLLLVFAGILLGIFLETLSSWVSRFTRLKGGWALAVVILLLLLAAAGIGWLLAAPIAEQIHELTHRMPEALQQLQERINGYKWGKFILDKLPAATNAAPQTEKFISGVTGFFSTMADVVVGLLVIVFVGIYVALAPQAYVNGVLSLVPKHKRARAREVMAQLGDTLRYWLLGQICSMAAIGVLTGMGLWLLGIPLALAIGLLAGILDFIPIFGPVVSAVPAVLFAFLQSPLKALYVVLLYVGINFVESHLLVPLVQQKAVKLPPVLTLVALVLFGGLLGFLGLLLATPIAAVLYILVKMLYVEDVIGETIEEEG